MKKKLSLKLKKEFPKKWNTLLVVLLVGLLAILIFALVKSSEYRDSSITKSAEIKKIKEDLALTEAGASLLALELNQRIDSLSIIQARKDSLLRIKNGQIAQLKNSFKISTKEWVARLENKDSLLGYAHNERSSLLAINKNLRKELSFVSSERDSLAEENASLGEGVKTILPLKERLKEYVEFLDYLSQWDRNLTKDSGACIYNGKRGFFQRKVKPKKIMEK